MLGFWLFIFPTNIQYANPTPKRINSIIVSLKFCWLCDRIIILLLKGFNITCILCTVLHII